MFFGSFLLFSVTAFSGDLAAQDDDSWVGSGPDGDHEQPIVNGSDESGFPSTVSVGAFGFSMCSSSLITPRILLTAAHCGSGLPPELVVELGEAYFGQTAASPEATLGFVDFIVHPDYQELSGMFEGQYDLGVGVLDADAPAEPVWFRTEPLTADDEGEEVMSVGYGITGSTASSSGGVKRSAPLIVDEIDEMFVLSNTSTNANGGQICSGDSGGPQYHQEEDGTWIQWSVHSWGDQDCLIRSGSTRTDVAADWILEQIEAVHGTTDRCEIWGYYGDGVCDTSCDTVDPDCAEADEDIDGEDEEGGGCGCSTATPAGAWGLLALAPLLARRRKR